MNENQDLPPLPETHWPRGYHGSVPSGGYTKDQMHDYARAALAAKAVPAGWKLVPVEPTIEMLKAADKADEAAYVGGADHGATAETIWAHMIDATPAPAPETTPAPRKAAMPKPNDLRERFERWALAQGWNIERRDVGDYQTLSTDQRWGAWLGCAADAERITVNLTCLEDLLTCANGLLKEWREVQAERARKASGRSAPARTKTTSTSATAAPKENNQ